MIRIILLRHGETTWNIEGRYQGQEDTPLSPRSIYRISLPTAGASIHSRSSSLISACGSHCANSSSSE